jgi:hypothetical protein
VALPCFVLRDRVIRHSAYPRDANAGDVLRGLDEHLRTTFVQPPVISEEL